MNKLTLIEGVMPHELVLYYFPTADDEEIDWILWNKSLFPFDSLEKMNEDIYEWYLKSKC